MLPYFYWKGWKRYQGLSFTQVLTTDDYEATVTPGLAAAALVRRHAKLVHVVCGLTLRVLLQIDVKYVWYSSYLDEVM